ncbi:hypothetical protein Sme01_47580 [Sphaerisporangium melleum]|uniref:Uncharacterized protein n=1 Tax=Sphaerisporangium melleum TaxID=321316 RepID=A0A917VVV7_9ACTN|nr:hypothetical protein [Sphaerisporangium melleum]GGL19732.1 hypothetical protein GCM10007964_72110 [Sphaerisporangium melleum]GII72282.1 hypothetical protein Sme01_47580 [Sphaerisporangium melleum]
MTGLVLRVPAEDHRALCTPDLTGLHTWGGTRAMVGTSPPAPGDAAGVRATAAARLRHPAADLADAVPVSQVTWTTAPRITADVPERH